MWTIYEYLKGVYGNKIKLVELYSKTYEIHKFHKKRNSSEEKQLKQYEEEFSLNTTKKLIKAKASSNLFQLGQNTQEVKEVPILKKSEYSLHGDYLFKIKSFEDLGYSKYDSFDWRKLNKYLDFKPSDNISIEDHFEKSKNLIQKLPLNLLVNHKDIKENTIILPNKNSMNKKTLILDLDETLIHCDNKYIYQNHDQYLTINNENNEIEEFPIFLRPGLKDFLSFASKHFEVGLFTAASKVYADTIIDFIDPDKEFFSFKLYRCSCINIKSSVNIKPLSLIENRNLDDIIIVDNNILSFCANISNGYLIPSFFSNKEDKELIKLECYLKEKFST